MKPNLIQALHGASLADPGFALCPENPNLGLRADNRRKRLTDALEHWVGRACETFLQAYQRKNAERVALRELRKLDDRLLRDIGLGRHNIETAVATLAASGSSKSSKGIRRPA